ncbi:GNAT family N-acetyltransferase [Rossellomorea aquimaris]|uniref:GNAT family N-acetyltransferase n=1 Tax=Rossellomorea aquimaris TaxID=189382 RepID=UPI0007D07A90|nr:GNAT family N-acetyltransferase [Rossellomorea aquimaris]
MKNYNIRKAVKEDALGIAIVHVHSWKTTYEGIVDDHYLESLSIEERQKKWIQILSSSSNTYVCEGKDGRIVGFVSYGKERTGEYEGELYALYLLKDYQGKGIGKDLFTSAVTSLKNQGFNSMFIWVLKDNPYKHFYYHFNPSLIKKGELKIGGRDYEEEGLLLLI